ncbi:MAG: cyclase family protein [Candidatus Binatia bacterium]
MPEKYTMEDVKALGQKYKNWGKWGTNDQLGTLNYITPEKVVESAKLVKQGKSFSLAIPFDDKGPQTGSFGRFNPIHFMLQDGGDIVAGAQNHLPNIRYTDDAVTMPLQCATQWDALAHILYEDKMYNGFAANEITSSGAKKNGIENAKSKIITRGVLLDMPRYKGKKWLEAGEAIYPADLDGAAAMAKVSVSKGDIVLIRTGQLAQVREEKNWGTYSGGPAPGLGVACASWLCEKQVAGYATDTWGTEVIPNETSDAFQPLHIILIVHAGMLVGEIFDFEELSEDCAKDNVYEFMFVAPPLPITGAVGSPVNPQAIK